MDIKPVETVPAQTVISKQQKQAGKAIAITYSIQAAALLEGSIFIVYLTRPKVKNAFAAQ